MKHKTLIVGFCLFAVGIFSALQAGETYHRQMRLNVWGNGLTPVNGDFNSTAKLRDAVQTGGSFGLDYQYYPWQSLGIQAGYQFGWMQFEKAYRPVANQTPTFVVHQITLNGIYNFTDVVGQNTRIRPIVTAGVGIYPYRVTQDGVSGDVQRLANGKKFEKTSFGLNGGVGLEIIASNHLSVIGQARYNYVFAKDDALYGANSNFDNQGLLNFGLGLSYNFQALR